MPIVFDNIMKPIAQSWATNSGNPATRHSFWSNRRARPLVEFIPMGSEQLAAMVRGWFLSSLFNQRPIKDNGPAGWQVQIWEPLGRGLVDFPYPLLSSYPVSKNDLPAAVFKSITIAMVKVNELGSVAPLRPYHRLMDLGNLESFKSRLELWIKDGKVAEGGARLRGDDVPVHVSRRHPLKSEVERVVVGRLGDGESSAKRRLRRLLRCVFVHAVHPRREVSGSAQPHEFRCEHLA